MPSFSYKTSVKFSNLSQHVLASSPTGDKDRILHCSLFVNTHNGHMTLIDQLSGRTFSKELIDQFVLFGNANN